LDQVTQVKLVSVWVEHHRFVNPKML